MKYYACSLLLFFVILFGCKQEYNYFNGIGKKPIYIAESELTNIINLPPQPIVNAGVIYLLDPYLFMVEQKKGIHVFEVSDTANPQNLTFIKVPAINDFTINGNVMYADNGPNLVGIDITDLYQVQVLSTIPNSFQPILFPPLYSGAFECGDPTKGVIVEWIDAELEDAKCSTN